LRIKTLAKAKLPTPWAEFSITAFEDTTNGEEHLAISLGNLDNDPLLRIHSQCLTGDALFSLRCDCGSQLEMALKKIASEEAGLIIYMAQEGRGIGLGNKIKAYELQDEGMNTVEANESLGFEADERNYSICGEILSSMNIASVRLMTNNPSKIEGLIDSGIDVVDRVSIEVDASEHNKDYLDVKADRMGHLFKK
jgi:GTP cyclohydrolase II|tara:strand:+ start:52 stop:636 length:585 start_codon:yes stop_codon:yes gene_type:complete